MTKVVIGIDISKRTFDACFQDKHGKWKHCNFENTPQGFTQFHKWICGHNLGEVHIVMEATGRYGEKLSYCCYNLGFPISIVNPARIKYYGQSKLSRIKTDKADARLIADFGMHNQINLWVPKCPARTKLQDLIRCLDNLKIDRTSLSNRIEGSSCKEVIATYKSLILSIQKKSINLNSRYLKL